MAKPHRGEPGKHVLLHPQAITNATRIIASGEPERLANEGLMRGVAMRDSTALGGRKFDPQAFADSHYMLLLNDLASRHLMRHQERREGSARAQESLQNARTTGRQIVNSPGFLPALMSDPMAFTGRGRSTTDMARQLVPDYDREVLKEKDIMQEVHTREQAIRREHDAQRAAQVIIRLRQKTNENGITSWKL